MQIINTCAIVVTYHPTATDLGNLHALVKEVSHIVVIDNGSAPETLKPLRATAAVVGAALIENKTNLGMAAALNQGMAWAAQHSFQFALLFDQDSWMEPGFLATMLQQYAQPRLAPLGIIAPTHVDREHGTPLPPRRGPHGQPIPITSGTLLPLPVWQAQGPFVETLFIDEIDTEYALRLFRAGYTIEISKKATLLHTIGTSTPVRLLGVQLFILTHHSPIRRYYIVRNRIWIMRHYAVSAPSIVLAFMREIGTDVLKVLMGESQRGVKIAYMLRGAVDGLLGRTGAYPGR